MRHTLITCLLGTRHMLGFYTARAVEAMQAAGAIETAVTPLIRDCGWHLMGTAVMGEIPAPRSWTNMASAMMCRGFT